MYAHFHTSHPVLDECTKNFAEAIAEQFRLPPNEALRRINAELASNPLTRGIRLQLGDVTLSHAADR